MMFEDGTVGNTGGTGGESPAGESHAAPETPNSFPQADFSILVGMFSTQAMIALGAIPNPATGRSEIQIEVARHLIDLLGVLDEKTRGNLDTDEAGMLETTLHHLRMSFLEQSRAQSS